MKSAQNKLSTFSSKLSTKKGFTLIELLIVMAILAILAVVVFVALNPAQRLQDTRDAKRVSDIQSILTAVHAYTIDNAGSQPPDLVAEGTTEVQLGTSLGTGGAEPVCTRVAGTPTNSTCVTAATGCVDLTSNLANYLGSIPMDPDGGTEKLTGYSITNNGGIVTVKACNAEGQTITATR